MTHVNFGLGSPSKFRSENIPWNRLGTVFVIPWKKQTEYRWNESKFSSVPCSADQFFSTIYFGSIACTLATFDTDQKGHSYKMSGSVPLCFNHAANKNMFSFAAAAVFKSVYYLIEHHTCLLSAYSVMHSLAGYLDIVQRMKVL